MGRRVGSVLLVGALAFVLYLPSVRHGFIGVDDPVYVTGNRHVLQGLTVEGLLWSFTATEGGNWHPLTWWSHMLAVDLFGTWAGGHHLMNAVLHACASAALLWTVSGLTGALLPSLAVASLFAVHPLHVESVAWVSERKDVLMALLWMLTLAVWTGYVRRPRPRTFLAAFALFLLGLTAKPMAVILPLVLVLLDFWPLDRLRPGPGRRRVRLFLEKVPFLLAAAAVSVLTLKTQHDAGALWRTGDMAPDFTMSLAGIQAANSVVSYVVYLRKALWPAGLAAFYPYPAHTIPAWTIGLSGLLLGGVTAAAVFLRRRAPWVVTGWGWYLLAFVPVIGIVQVGSQGRADRYAYLPLIGFWLAVVWSIWEPLRRRPDMRRPLLVIGLAANVALAALAVRQLGYWRDTETLFKRALAVTGSNDQAHRVLGEDARRQGRFKEAEGHFREEVLLAPRSSGAHNRLGLTLFDQGRVRRRGEGVPGRAALRSPERRGAQQSGARPRGARQAAGGGSRTARSAARLPGSRRDLVESRLLPRATGENNRGDGSLPAGTRAEPGPHAGAEPMGESATRRQPGPMTEFSPTPAAPLQARMWRRPVLGIAAAALLVAVLLVFGQVRSFGFVEYDDGEYVFRNAHLQQGGAWERVRWAFTTLSRRKLASAHLAVVHRGRGSLRARPGVAPRGEPRAARVQHPAAFRAARPQHPRRLEKFPRDGALRAAPAAGRVGGVGDRAQGTAHGALLPAGVPRLRILRASPDDRPLLRRRRSLRRRPARQAPGGRAASGPAALRLVAARQGRRLSWNTAAAVRRAREGARCSLSSGRSPA